MKILKKQNIMNKIYKEKEKKEKKEKKGNKENNIDIVMIENRNENENYIEKDIENEKKKYF